MAETTPPTAPAAGAAAAPAAPGQPAAPPAPPPVVVKKYANRRLYNTETSSYITLDNLAEMIRAGRDFVVYDAKSAEDITRGVLTQIIVEEESKGSSMLPTAFLRQLIGFYGGSLQGVVPRYLEQAMSSFARQQAQVRQVMQQTLSPFLPAGVEEMSRQNIAMMERAMSMFNPFHRGAEPSHSSPEATTEAAPPPPEDDGELERLRAEVESLKKQLVAARAEALPLSLPSAPLPIAPLPAASTVAAVPPVAPPAPAKATPPPPAANVRMTPPAIGAARKERQPRTKPN